MLLSLLPLRDGLKGEIGWRYPLDKRREGLYNRGMKGSGTFTGNLGDNSFYGQLRMEENDD